MQSAFPRRTFGLTHPKERVLVGGKVEGVEFTIPRQTLKKLRLGGERQRHRHFRVFVNLIGIFVETERILYGAGRS